MALKRVWTEKEQEFETDFADETWSFRLQTLHDVFQLRQLRNSVCQRLLPAPASAVVSIPFRTI